MQQIVAEWNPAPHGEGWHLFGPAPERPASAPHAVVESSPSGPAPVAIVEYEAEAG